MPFQHDLGSVSFRLYLVGGLAEAAPTPAENLDFHPGASSSD